jgi:alanine dehydrogenase
VSTPWLTEDDVRERLTLARAIDAVEAALAREATGAAKTMVKTHVAWGEGETHSLHAIGGVDGDLVGTKTWAHTAGGANPLLVLWDSETGERRAIIEAFLLGQLRTAAMSGVATRALADPTARTVAVIGTGKQAGPQVDALREVLAVDEVRVFGRDAARRDAFAERVGATSCASVEEAVAGASVVTTVTRATAPFLSSAMVASGTHVNAVGAITPERAELCVDLVDRCLIVTDSVASAERLGAEVRGRALRPLSSMLGRARPAADLTLFKAMGIGLADVALGRAILEAS